LRLEEIDQETFRLRLVSCFINFVRARLRDEPRQRRLRLLRPSSPSLMVETEA
jgi:hypothetical protein